MDKYVHCLLEEFTISLKSTDKHPLANFHSKWNIKITTFAMPWNAHQFNTIQHTLFNTKSIENTMTEILTNGSNNNVFVLMISNSSSHTLCLAWLYFSSHATECRTAASSTADFVSFVRAFFCFYELSPSCRIAVAAAIATVEAQRSRPRPTIEAVHLVELFLHVQQLSLTVHGRQRYCFDGPTRFLVQSHIFPPTLRVVTSHLSCR